MTRVRCSTHSLIALFICAMVLTGCTSPQGSAAEQPSATGTEPMPSSTPSPSSSTSGSPSATVDVGEAPSDHGSPTPPAPPPDPSTSASSESTGSALEGADVTVTYAARTGAGIEVSGFVAVVEAGTCTAEVTSADGSTSSLSQASYEDATTTSCGTLLVPGADIGAGPWSVRLGFLSSRYEGWSQPVVVSP